jgi:hypothetical protein
LCNKYVYGVDPVLVAAFEAEMVGLGEFPECGGGDDVMAAFAPGVGSREKRENNE